MTTTAPTSAKVPSLASSTRSGPMQLIFRFIRERKGLFALNLGLRLFKDLLPFLGPIFVGIAVDILYGLDRSLVGFTFEGGELRSIYTIAALMAILAVAKMVFGYVHTIVAAHMGRHIVEAARRISPRRRCRWRSTNDADSTAATSSTARSPIARACARSPRTS